MPDAPPDRLWLPLLILDTAGPLYSKVRFQKIAFLAQYEGRIDEYDFARHHYGPYSDGLDLDTASYPSLITYDIAQSYRAPDHHYYTYEITGKGKVALGSLTGTLDASYIDSVKKTITRVVNKSLCELLEEVYDKFAIKKDDSLRLESQVKRDLSMAMPPIRNAFDRYKNPLTYSILSVLDIIRMILSEVKTADTVQTGVMMNLSKEITQKCQDLARSIRPDDDDDPNSPAFAEIDDLLYYLTQYCAARKLARDPMTMPLGEMMTGEEADRLSKAFWEYEIPK